MKPWHKETEKFLDKLKPSIITGHPILKYLKKAGYQVSPKQLGRLMKKLGFKGERKTRQGFSNYAFLRYVKFILPLPETPIYTGFWLRKSFRGHTPLVTGLT